MAEAMQDNDLPVDNSEKLNDLKSHLTPEEQVKALQEFLDSKKRKEENTTNSPDYVKKAKEEEKNDPEEGTHDEYLKEMLESTEDMDTQDPNLNLGENEKATVEFQKFIEKTSKKLNDSIYYLLAGTLQSKRKNELGDAFKKIAKEQPKDKIGEAFYEYIETNFSNMSEGINEEISNGKFDIEKTIFYIENHTFSDKEENLLNTYNAGAIEFGPYTPITEVERYKRKQLLNKIPPKNLEEME